MEEVRENEERDRIQEAVSGEARQSSQIQWILGLGRGSGEQEDGKSEDGVREEK